MFLKLFLLAFSVNIAQSRDFVRDSFSFIDHNTDPCDNFYRHACPLNGIPEWIKFAYADKMQELKEAQSGRIWKHLEIEKDANEMRAKELPSPLTVVTNIFWRKCEEEQSGTYDFLKYIQTVFTGPKCIGPCLTSISYDTNCTRASEILAFRLQKLDYSDFALWKNVLVGKLNVLQKGMDAASYIIDSDVQDGVATIRSIVETMIYTVEQWIKKTPWAQNMEVVESIEAVIGELSLYDKLASFLRDNLEFLLTVEKDYLKCISIAGNSEEDKALCLLLTSILIEPKELPDTESFFNKLNARNGHPMLTFSYYFYDLAKTIEEYAAILGAVGFTAGHEVSHTLIENANYLEFLPYFSNESMQCIQNQYQSTCDEFKEESCEVHEGQVDENGSDILGTQLAYSIFEEVYKDRFQDVYITLPTGPITMQQLFFYSMAFTWCEGIPQDPFPGAAHSAWNVRINAIAQHPAFQEAFQCDADSRMMKSATKQCIIFGESAPETRRKIFNGKL